MNGFIFSSQIQAHFNGSCINETLKSLWNGFCFSKSDIEFQPEESFTFSVGNIDKPQLEADSDYAVAVTPNGAAISATDKSALVRGFLSLITRIKPLCLEQGKEQFMIEACSYRDNYDIKNRMAHLCLFPEMSLHFLRKTIRVCAMFQYTHIIIEFWGSLKFDCMWQLAWPNAYSKEEIKGIIDEIYDLGMKPIPMFNHLGHASGCRLSSGKHVVLDQDPSMQMLFDEDGWTWNIRNPESIALLRKIRGELYELFGDSEYIHIGCDEAYLYGSNEDLAVKFADFLACTVEEIIKEENHRPIIWGDMLLEAKSCGVDQYNGLYFCSCQWESIAKTVLERLDRRTIIADWQYNIKNAPVETIRYLKNFGFDVIGCAWNDKENVKAIVDTVRAEEVYGFMDTTWHTLCNGYKELCFGAMLCEAQNKDYKMPPIPEIDAVLMSETAVIARKVISSPDYKSSGWTERQIHLTQLS